MTTVGIMLDRIADEMARSDLTTTQIPRAIQSAIRTYERERFYFNEALATFTTSDGQEYYIAADSAAVTKITTASVIDDLRITVSGTHYPLTRRDWSWINDAMSNSSHEGDPTDYAIFGQQVRLYPIPGAARVIVAAIVEKAATITATSSSNYWFTDAEELIRASAMRRLYAEVEKSPEEALLWGKIEKLAYDTLKAETETRISTGQVTPTEF